MKLKWFVLGGILTITTPISYFLRKIYLKSQRLKLEIQKEIQRHFKLDKEIELNPKTLSLIEAIIRRFTRFSLSLEDKSLKRKRFKYLKNENWKKYTESLVNIGPNEEKHYQKVKKLTLGILQINEYSYNNTFKSFEKSNELVSELANFKYYIISDTKLTKNNSYFRICEMIEGHKFIQANIDINFFQSCQKINLPF